MAFVSREKFVIRVLQDAQKSTEWEFSDEDAKLVDSRLPGIFAELASRDIFFVGDYDRIPEEAVEPLAEFVISRALTVFGLARDLGAEMDAESRLKTISRPMPARRTLKIGRQF